MHANHTAVLLHQDDGVGAVVAEAIGYGAALLFVMVGVGMTSLGWKWGRLPAFNHLYWRVATYALVLGLLWPVAALNRFDAWLPDGRAVPVALVLLNALVWTLGLCEVLAWFLSYDGNPPHWNVYDLLVLIVRVCVATLALVGFSNEATRFVALMMVIPLALVLGWAGVVHANDQRNLTPPDGFDWQSPQWTLLGQQHMAAIWLVVLGVGTLVCEMLGPSYGNALGHGWAAAFMFAEHVGLGALLLFLSTSSAAEIPSAVLRKSSDPAPPPSDISAQVNAMNLPGFANDRQRDGYAPSSLLDD